MSARQLKETTMDPATRKLEQVEIDPATGALAGDLVERLMGRRPELRLAFIQENVRLAGELDV
jgi:topoisomerase-4 subunit B